jgi:hypothetical protein
MRYLFGSKFITGNAISSNNFGRGRALTIDCWSESGNLNFTPPTQNKKIYNYF